jgi:drug/metabolite transporter (DMT)-like permease
MPPEKSTLIFLSSAPCYILFAPLAFKILEKKLLRRRTIIYLVMSFWGVLCIFATGNLQIINDSSKMWQVIVCMSLAGGCLAVMHTTVFPEIVEQAENSLIGRKVDREKMNLYLCSLFVFLSSVS